jgi:hypothetical protein
MTKPIARDPIYRKRAFEVTTGSKKSYSVIRLDAASELADTPDCEATTDARGARWRDPPTISVI